MKDTMGLIHHLKNEDSLQEITWHRSMASVPFAGRYRLVDFVLSNLVNAGIENIGIITSLNLRSLLDHLGSGKDWGLEKKHDGLFIMPTAHTRGGGKRKVDLQDLYANLDYFQRSRQKYIIIAGSNVVCNIDYKKTMQYHKEIKADITLVYSEREQFSGENSKPNVVYNVDKSNRIMGIHKSSFQQKNNKVSMDMYIMEKSLLLDIITECAARKKWDLVNFISGHLKELKVYGYAYQGYLAIIDSITSYFRHHMDLLTPEIWQELFFNHGMIYTKFKDGPPTKYYDMSDVRNALVANGCMIEGRVENSVLYRNVRIGRGAVIRNSIIMPKVKIEEDAVLDGVILDKDVHVRKGARLVGEKSSPIIIKKRSVV